MLWLLSRSRVKEIYLLWKLGRVWNNFIGFKKDKDVFNGIDDDGVTKRYTRPT